MKKAQREPYLILNEVALPNGGNPNLCSWCKYAKWQGYCEDSYPECQHPLQIIQEQSFYIGLDRSDCWGFRPEVSREDAVDVVGIWLQGKAVDWSTVPMIGRRQ
jgi:hypothetical protein